MYPKTVLALVLIVLVALTAGTPLPSQPPNVVRQERGCAHQGGVCKMQNECAGIYVEFVDLCPDQSKAGVKCCYI